MTMNDLRRLITGRTLFRLDAILSPKLIPILYAAGLAALLIWAVTHFFASFGAGFGHGLWGLLEIAVYGLLMFIVLRIGCEALMVYFQDRASDHPTGRSTASLLDEVRDAIRELAEDDNDYSEVGEYEAYPPRSASTPPRRSGSTSAPPPVSPSAAASVPPAPAGEPPATVDDKPNPEFGGERTPATKPGETHDVRKEGDEPPRT